MQTRKTTKEFIKSTNTFSRIGDGVDDLIELKSDKNIIPDYAAYDLNNNNKNDDKCNNGKGGKNPKACSTSNKEEYASYVTGCMSDRDQHCHRSRRQQQYHEHDDERDTSPCDAGCGGPDGGGGGDNSHSESHLVHDDLLAQEVLSKAGPAYTYQRRDHSHDISLSTQQQQQQQQPQQAQDINRSSETSNLSIYHDYANNEYNMRMRSSYSAMRMCEEIKLAAKANEAATGSAATTSVNEELRMHNHASVCNSYSSASSCHNSYKMASSSSTTAAAHMINQDPDPIRIVKPNTKNIVYKQQVNIRYLQPPTPPPPAPIIIRYERKSSLVKRAF